jgi:antitoxin (DNA-binding transcriptional repressor) of toxin-antitoxin stability system
MHAVSISARLHERRGRHLDALVPFSKTDFSRLVARAQAGEEIVSLRGPTPAAEIVPHRAPAAPRVPGSLKGRIAIARDVDETPEDFGFHARSAGDR